MPNLERMFVNGFITQAQLDAAKCFLDEFMPRNRKGNELYVSIEREKEQGSDGWVEFQLRVPLSAWDRKVDELTPEPTEGLLEAAGALFDMLADQRGNLNNQPN